MNFHNIACSINIDEHERFHLKGHAYHIKVKKKITIFTAIKHLVFLYNLSTRLNKEAFLKQIFKCMNYMKQVSYNSIHVSMEDLLLQEHLN